MNSNFSVNLATWINDRRELRFVREQVFMQEQHVPEKLEWDGRDPHAVHLLARDKVGNPIGTVRMLGDGHIGRMAVLRPWRGQGVGSALLKTILGTAHSVGMDKVHLDAQIQAIGFYQRHGFSVAGEEFMDAGISHLHMTRLL